MITKLKISQKYNFSTLFYWSYFTIDFDKKIAFFDERIPKWTDEFDEEFLSSISFDDNFNLFLAFSENVRNVDFKLKTNEINNFQRDFEKLHLFDNYNPKPHPKCPAMDELCKIEVIVYSEDSKSEKYEITNEYPNNWIEFGILLNELLGFDVLNIENLKFLVTELYFNIKNDGVYLNDKKLKLTKFNYYYKTMPLIVPACFSIDFNKETICNLAKINRNCSNKLDNEILLKITNLIEKYAIYRWYRHEFLFNSVDCNCLEFFDGVNWIFELVFEDKYILHIGGWNYPDNYLNFGKELIQLMDMDLLNVSNAFSE